MKKPLLITVGILAAYAALYVVVRISCHGTVTTMVADTTGAYHPKTFEAVCFIEPVSGFKRYASKITFAAFYPLGRLDHLITGRLYELADWRDVPIMKPQP